VSAGPISPERAVELAVAELVKAGWPVGGVRCPEVVGSRHGGRDGLEESLVVECVKAVQPMPSEAVWSAEVNVFYQGDLAREKQGVVDMMTGTLGAVLRAAEGNLLVSFEADETGGYPTFAVAFIGRPELVSTGPEDEGALLTRKRRDGVKLVCGFEVTQLEGPVVVGPSVDGEYLIFPTSAGMARVRMLYVNDETAEVVRLAVVDGYLYVTHVGGTHKVRMLDLVSGG
jgi:hypothetical protein